MPDVFLRAARRMGALPGVRDFTVLDPQTLALRLAAGSGSPASVECPAERIA